MILNIKKYIKKYKIYLISFCTLFFLSCSKEYSINWVSIYDANIDHVNIMFYGRKVKVIPSVSKIIKVPKNDSYFGIEHPSNIRMELYPSPDQLENGGNIEIFLYPPKPRIEGNTITFMPHERVVLYYYKFKHDNKIYILISANNSMCFDKDNFQFENKAENLEVIMQKAKESDFIFYSEFDTKYLSDNYIDYGGYIVQSKIDGNIFWLDPTYLCY